MTFYVWVTLLTEGYVDGLIAALVNAGYEVGALADSGVLTQTTDVSAMVALKVIQAGQKNKDIDRPKFLSQLKELLKDKGYKYHSLVVHELNGSFTWCSGDIKLEPRPEQTRFDKIAS